MKNPKILVTAAAGKTGSYVVKQLLEQGFPVRAMVRRSNEKSEQLASLGAEVLVGDFLDLQSLRVAMTGINRAYFCYPPSDRLLEATANFAYVAKEMALESVVNMSQMIAREGHPSPLSRQHWLAERVLDMADVGATHIRPTFFAEMAQLMGAQSIAAEGKLYLSHGDKKHAPVTAEDIARVVVGVLTNPQKHIGQTYTVTGPKNLSQSEIAKIIGNVLGKAVEYVDIPLEHWQQAMADAGQPAFLINHLSRVAEDYKEGHFEGGTDVVLKVGGQSPQSFEEFISQHIEEFDGTLTTGQTVN